MKKFLQNFQFSNFENFWKKLNLQKIIKFQIALKSLLFELRTNQKIATRFLNKEYIQRKFLARPHWHAQRTPDLIFEVLLNFRCIFYGFLPMDEE
eukprot:UN13162